MPYLTEDGYKARFGGQELAQVLSTDADLDIEAAIADAESIVNGYLAAVPDRAYTVPLVGAVPSRIEELTADLARYEIHAARVTHEMKRRRNEAIAWLEALVQGLVTIPELLPDDGAPPTTGGMEVSSAERVFDACTLRWYVGW